MRWEDNYCGRAISPGLNDSPADVSAINPRGRGAGGLTNTLFPARALRRRCREVLPFCGYLRKHSAARRDRALELDHALGFSSDRCNGNPCSRHGVFAIEQRLLLQRQPSHAEPGEKLSTFTRLLGVQEAARSSVAPHRRAHSQASWRKHLEPSPAGSAGCAPAPVLAGGLCWGSAGDAPLPLWPWGLPATAAGSCVGLFCASWANTNWHGPWSGWFAMEVLPAELLLLLSNTLKLPCLLLYGL